MQFTVVSTECNDELASPELAEESLIAPIQHKSSQSLYLHWDKIAQKTTSDPSLKNLLTAVESGFDFKLIR